MNRRKTRRDTIGTPRTLKRTAGNDDIHGTTPDKSILVRRSKSRPEKLEERVEILPTETRAVHRNRHVNAGDISPEGGASEREGNRSQGTYKGDQCAESHAPHLPLLRRSARNASNPASTRAKTYEKMRAIQNGSGPKRSSSSKTLLHGATIQGRGLPGRQGRDEIGLERTGSNFNQDVDSKLLNSAMSLIRRQDAQLESMMSQLDSYQALVSQLQERVRQTQVQLSDVEAELESACKEKDSIALQLDRSSPQPKNPKRRRGPLLHSDLRSYSDPFYTTVDRISEAQVKSGGDCSLEGINRNMDRIVIIALNSAEALTRDDHGSVLFEHDADSLYKISGQRLWRMLANEREKASTHRLSALDKGLLLDALLHQEMCRILSDRIFARKVVQSADHETRPSSDTDMLYCRILENEEWSVSQRWRAIAAKHSLYGTAEVEKVAHEMHDTIVNYLLYAYKLPIANLEGISEQLKERLLPLSRHAYELWKALKTGILQYEVFVTEYCGKEDCLQTAHGQELWPELGDEASLILGHRADKVLGTYSLGLAKRDSGGEVSYLSLPKVITEAIVIKVGEESCAG